MTTGTRPHRSAQELLNTGEWFALPNDYVDKIMGQMQEPTDFLVLLVIKRRTHGFNRERRRISQAQIVNWTGLCRNTVKACLGRLQKAGHIVKTGGTDHRQACEWALNEDLVLAVGQSVIVSGSTIDPPSEFSGSTIDPQRVNHRPTTVKDTFKDTKKVNTTANTDANAVAVLDSDQIESNLTRLSELGITEPKRSQLARLPHVTADYLETWADYAESEDLGPGFLVIQIESGADPPAGNGQRREGPLTQEQRHEKYRQYLPIET